MKTVKDCSGKPPAVNPTFSVDDSRLSFGLNLRNPSSSSMSSEKFKEDLKNFPDDRGMEEFIEMSVEDFGPAFLARFGWVEGKGIGKNAKEEEDVKIVVYKPRNDKQGLGFVGELHTKGGNENDNETKNNMQSNNSNGNVPRDEGYNTGKDVWLNSHIRVRIVSKELKRGSLYLDKGEIIDVVGPTTCDILMYDSKEVIQGVDQKFLETVLPRIGGSVLVLSGSHKGVYGSLVETDMENETAVVQDADSHDLIQVHLEQIAEFTGDPNEIGY